LRKKIISHYKRLKGKKITPFNMFRIVGYGRYSKQ
jgi:hypothetical protein